MKKKYELRFVQHDAHSFLIFIRIRTKSWWQFFSSLTKHILEFLNLNDEVRVYQKILKAKIQHFRCWAWKTNFLRIKPKKNQINRILQISSFSMFLEKFSSYFRYRWDIIRTKSFHPNSSTYLSFVFCLSDYFIQYSAFHIRHHRFLVCDYVI